MSLGLHCFLSFTKRRWAFLKWYRRILRVDERMVCRGPGSDWCQLWSFIVSLSGLLFCLHWVQKTRRSATSDASQMTADVRHVSPQLIPLKEYAKEFSFAVNCLFFSRLLDWWNICHSCSQSHSSPQRVPAHAQTKLADHRADAFTSVSSAI